MKIRLVVLAAIAVAGHQNLMAGYRTIEDAQPDVVYSMPVQPVAAEAAEAANAECHPSQSAHPQSAQIRLLENENAQLRQHLRSAEWELGKRRALSEESAASTSLGFELGSVKSNQPASRKAEILMRARAASSIEVVGYTDNTGSAAINKRIALSRAQLVKDMLVSNGISPKIIKIKEQSGVYYATNDTAEGRAANRRAIVTFN